MPPKPVVDPWIFGLRLQVGSRIRSFRCDRSYSQESLAERAGISRDTVIYAENGTKAVSVDIIHRIAGALAVPPAWLFADDRTVPPGGGAEGG